jgi:AmiR/NasT family two-component response regulator
MTPPFRGISASTTPGAVHHGCTADEAFTLLVDASQRTNRKLRDVAVAIVKQAHRRT